MKNKTKSMHRSLLFAATPLVLTISAHASTIWDGDGPANPSWALAANWSDNILPTFNNSTDLSFPTSAVVIFNSTLGGANRVIRSMTFGENVDSAFGVSFSESATATARNLTMGGGGSAAVTVDAGSTGTITIGNPYGLATGSLGTMSLADDLTVTHNGSGLLNFNRGILLGSGFGITKTGTGTMQLNNNNTFTGAININQGTLIANSFATAGNDLNAASAINLGGGTLDIRASGSGAASSGVSKTYATVPLNVNSASILSWTNINPTSYTLTFSGSAAFALNEALTIQNNSTDTTLVNGINISRALTGTKNMTVETYNNISSSAASYSLGRVALSGDNTGWSGNLVVAKGTAGLFGSSNTGAAGGTGDFIIGTTANAFGAGLTFFTGADPGTTLVYTNDITVRSGGFRSIKGSYTDHNIELNGDIALEGDLNVDHLQGENGRSITIGGDISGVGGLNITRSLAIFNTSLILTGTKTFTGPTTINGGTLIVNGSLATASGVSVTAGDLGGTGTIGGSVTVAADGNVSPGGIAGTLAITGGLDISAMSGGAGKLKFGLDALAGPNDQLTVGGSLALGALALDDLAITNLGGLQGGTYTLITSGSFTGTVDSTPAEIATGFSGQLQMTGNNLQLVVTATGGFPAWQAANSTLGGLDEDHDNDGVDNGTEYFLGGNTNTTGFTTLPGVDKALDGTLSVTWIKAPSGYSGAYSADFVVETSSTLASPWTPAALGSGADQVEITVEVTGDKVKYTFPAGIKNFSRLKVTGP